MGKEAPLLTKAPLYDIIPLIDGNSVFFIDSLRPYLVQKGGKKDEYRYSNFGPSGRPGEDGELWRAIASLSI